MCMILGLEVGLRDIFFLICLCTWVYKYLVLKLTIFLWVRHLFNPQKRSTRTYWIIFCLKFKYPVPIRKTDLKNIYRKYISVRMDGHQFRKTMVKMVSVSFTWRGDAERPTIFNVWKPTRPTWSEQALWSFQYPWMSENNKRLYFQMYQ